MARIAVAATAPFGAAVLEGLARSHEITALLTRPDARRGRGRREAPPPAKVAAERLGLRVLQPDRPEPGLDLGAPLVVVCAYGLLVPEPLLAERDWLNVHPSLLPRWRGAAPVERAILAGDDVTGVTIHETVKELDAGPVAAQEAFPIAPDDDAGAVLDRAAIVAVAPARSRPRTIRARPSSAERRWCHVRRQDRSGRPGPRPRPAARGARPPRARTLAAHRGAGRDPRTAADGLAREGGGDGLLRAGRGPARRRQADGRCCVAARPRDDALGDLARQGGGVRRDPPRLRGRGVRRPRASDGFLPTRRP